MEDYAKEILRKICCTCLSVDRKLSQLCKIEDGVNNLFFLVSVDSEAYEVSHNEHFQEVFQYCSFIIMDFCKVRPSSIQECNWCFQTIFRSDVTWLYICWECDAIMKKQQRFKTQVCVAQKKLSQVIDGQTIIEPQNSLSKLTRVHQTTYDNEFIFNNITIDNFIDCGPDINPEILMKSETNIPLLDIDYKMVDLSDAESSTDNILDEIKVLDNKIEIKPLSLNKRKSNNTINRVKRKVNNQIQDKKKEASYPELNEITVSNSKIEIKPPKQKRRLKNESTAENSKVLDKKNEIESLLDKRKVKKEESFIKEDGFTRIRMTEEELLDSIERRKLENDYVLALYKCESCVEVFKDQSDLEEHNSSLHLQKPKFIQCSICQVYIKFWWLSEHKDEHYIKYQCDVCTEVCYNVVDMLLHLKNIHDMRNALTPVMLRKLKRRAEQTKRDLAPKKSDVPEENMQKNEENPSAFQCSECNKLFENRYLRYKHVLKMHREGHKCDTCGKTFAFKNTLNKHVQIHGAPQPMEQCPVCGKMVRRDRTAAHARIHAARASLLCVACDKRFVSRDSYEKHLKYSSKHAVTDVHKYKCTMCDKGFRTTRELNDHVDYNHMGKTQHKCPICHKALATRRCVTRHVSRAHLGIKEKSGDKILCQTCGKAFRDKKCLREHELIHTGEKPLSCSLCGRTFRQSACLYTHMRRVHKAPPVRRSIQHAAPDATGVDVDTTIN